MITFPWLGKTWGYASFEIGNDLWGRMAVESRMSYRDVENLVRVGSEDLHQVLASGSSMAGSTFRRLTLRMKP